MGDVVATPFESEPVEWFVVFHRKAASRLFSLLAFGEFKHVSAFGYCPGFKVWLIYDVQWSGTRLKLLANTEAGKRAIGAWVEDCDILKIAHQRQTPGFSSRLGFYCVTAAKHLIGLRCVAVRPDALYRQIIRNGGTPIHDRRQPATASR